jgi:hypothetical protein
MSKSFRNRNLLDPEYLWFLYKIYREHEETGVNYPVLARKYKITAKDMYLFINRYQYKIKSNPKLHQTLLDKYSHFLELKKEMESLAIKEYMAEYYPAGVPRHFPEVAIHLKVNKIIADLLLKYGEPMFGQVDEEKQLEFFSFPLPNHESIDESAKEEEQVSSLPEKIHVNNCVTIEEHNESPPKNDIELTLMEGVQVSIKKSVSSENVFKIINLMRYL